MVYADMGNWTEIRGEFALRQVSHRQFFYTPESCTNHAESANNALGNMERIFRHITGRYLDAYAAQLAWRMTCVNRDMDTNFADLMKAMMDGGRSAMAGYFLPRSKGGKKRQCEVTNPDGSVGYWTPPSREESRKAREAKRKAAGAPLTPLLSTARSARWKKDFSFVSAADFLTDAKVIPTSPGVYAFFLRSGDQLLSSAGHLPDPRLPAWKVDGRTHLYTGETFGLRQRLVEHLLGDVAVSTFRGSLLSLYWEAGIRSGEAPDFADRESTEIALNEWLGDEVVIGFKVCGYTLKHQNEVLERTASPLNITDRSATPFSRSLSDFRRRFEKDVSGGWKPPAPKERRKYRR